MCSINEKNIIFTVLIVISALFFVLYEPADVMAEISDAVAEISDDAAEISDDAAEISDDAAEISDDAAGIPMVEKHIFTPAADKKNADDLKGPSENKKGPDNSLLQKIKKEIQLTGIIISPVSKKALIQYRKRGRKSEPARFYQSGDSIEAYLLKDVFSNYIVISQNDQEVKLGLFRERTDRPLPPKIVEKKDKKSVSPVQSAKTKGGAVKQPVSKDKTAKTPLADSPAPSLQNSVNPFMKALKNTEGTARFPSSTGVSSGKDDGTPSQAAANPFLQAIQRARERQENQ